MRKLVFITVLVAALLAVTACQLGGGETHPPIPAKDLLPAVGEEAPDDIIGTPFGPAYRANHHQEGVENPWPPIESTEVVLGSGSKVVHISYRDYIETKAGEAGKNILFIRIPDRDIKSLNLYASDIPTGIEVTEGMRWYGPGPIAPVLVIEVSQDMKPGQYTFEIGLEINGKDYGTIPCTIKVLE